MKLGEWIKKYRHAHGMSMQDFANMVGISKAYVGQLEKGVNPRTGKPISPTILAIGKISREVGIPINEFLEMLDKDQPVTIPSETAILADAYFVNRYNMLDDVGRAMVDSVMNTRLEQIGVKLESLKP